MINIRICSLISSNFYIKNKPLRNFAQPAKANWPENRRVRFFVTINNASYSAAALAASYAYGITRNHPFVDGNKRTALVVSETFLNLNGHWLDATDAELVVQFLALASGDLPEDELARWFREQLVQG